MIEKKVFEAAAPLGSEAVKKAFEKLSSVHVDASVQKIESISVGDVAKSFSELDQAVIAYAQMLSGPEGVALLIMSRENALNFVDLIMGQKIGTTGILKDYDRSVIKETLNILSNAYIEALAKQIGTTLMIGPPYMATGAALERFIPSMLKDESKDGAMFLQSSLTVSEQNIQSQLYFIFQPDIVKEMKSL